MSRRGVDPIFSTTTPIRYCNYSGGGTGFFFNYNDRTFLVTNRHVVAPDDEDVTPDEAFVWFRDSTNPGNARRNRIRINADGEPRWRGHPAGAENVDLAVIPLHPRFNTLDELLDEETETHSGNFSFTPEHFLHENIGVEEHVSIIGYPGDFMDRSTRFPVRRNALISSPYGHGFESRPFFLTDARMHPGTSGSPVVMSTGGVYTSHGDVPDGRQKGHYLLGIHSATFYGTGFEEQNNSDDDPSSDSGEQNFKLDLNVAWYAELLLDILGDS